jgi:hypothetical protein
MLLLRWVNELCFPANTQEELGNTHKGIRVIFIFLVQAEFLMIPGDRPTAAAKPRPGLGALSVGKLWAKRQAFNRPLTISGRDHGTVEGIAIP